MAKVDNQVPKQKNEAPKSVPQENTEDIKKVDTVDPRIDSLTKKNEELISKNNALIVENIQLKKDITTIKDELKKASEPKGVVIKSNETKYKPHDITFIKDTQSTPYIIKKLLGVTFENENLWMVQGVNSLEPRVVTESMFTKTPIY